MLDKLRRMARWDRETAVRVMTLWFCAQDRRIGRAGRWVARIAALYAYSPIDLIPDFIPFLGHLDDLLLIPAAAAFVRRRAGAAVWEEAAERARGWVAARGAGSRPRAIRIALWTFGVLLLLAVSGFVFAIWVLYQLYVKPSG